MPTFRNGVTYGVFLLSGHCSTSGNRTGAQKESAGHTCNGCGDPQMPGQWKNLTSDPISERRHPKVFAEGHIESMKD